MVEWSFPSLQNGLIFKSYLRSWCFWRQQSVDWCERTAIQDSKDNLLAKLHYPKVENSRTFKLVWGEHFFGVLSYTLVILVAVVLEVKDVAGSVAALIHNASLLHLLHLVLEGQFSHLFIPSGSARHGRQEACQETRPKENETIRLISPVTLLYVNLTSKVLYTFCLALRKH